MIYTVSNHSFEAIRVPSVSFYICLCEGAALSGVNLLGSVFIGKYSFSSESTFSGYNGLGCHSFVSLCDVGRYSTIGSRVSMGAFSHPTDWLSVNEFQYRDTSQIYGEKLTAFKQPDKSYYKKTTIGPDVWICDNVFVKRGVSIGLGAIIGAGSVVTKDVPPYAIFAGNPAALIRFRHAPEVCKKLEQSCWWNLSVPELDSLSLPFDDPNKCANILLNARK